MPVIKRHSGFAQPTTPLSDIDYQSDAKEEVQAEQRENTKLILPFVEDSDSDSESHEN